ncbi:MAG: MarR family transcriptional regulator [Acidobacteriota bacterium]|nr:MarR family transcriptional regulator [Acidobacteriota bacterium]
MDSPAATHVWLVLYRAARAVERNALASIAALGLGLSDFAVLELLLHKGPMPVNSLGRKVLLTSGSITTAVSRLETRNLVERKPHATDRRARIVELTPAGRKLIECAFTRHEQDMEKVMSVLKPAERTELIRLLKKVGLWASARAE